MKANLTGFVATALIFTLVGAALSIAVEISVLSLELIVGGLMLGSIVAAGATILSALLGGARNIPVFTLGAALSSAALLYGMSLLEFSEVSLAAVSAAGVYGFVAGLFGSLTARILHGPRNQADSNKPRAEQ